jgi:riboflavin synthase
LRLVGGVHVVYTGIIEATGAITRNERSGAGRRLRVETDLASDLEPGDSIAVSGVCLTVERGGGDWFEAYAMGETLARTYLGDLAPGDAVNLERPMPADGRFDGHVVKATVDSTTEVTDVRVDGDERTYEFAIPEGRAAEFVEKGAVTVDGIGLTVVDCDEETFSVSVIPETLARTTLSEKAVGDAAHVETDVLAKYVRRRTAVES